MAKLIGAIGTSHIPAIGGAIHKGLQQDPYWKPFFDGFPPVREWLGQARPDIAPHTNELDTPAHPGDAGLVALARDYFHLSG